jgi:catechol 2,3-dioxygenase-like lactoylglutathione lyase family enzyme
MGGWTIHLGSKDQYLALYTPGEAQSARFAKGVPLNHVGLVVDDLATAERVVIEAGLEPFGHGDYTPGRRFYFFDWDGIEFEVVSYALPTT